MQKVRFLIIGAGVSGLSFAQLVNSDDYILVESESEVGGQCRSVHVGEFTWDFAGHFFHYKDEAIKNFMFSLLDENEIIRCRKVANIFVDGCLVDYPIQKNIHQLPKDVFIDCLVDLFNTGGTKPKNFLHMLYARYGKSITDKFLKPLNEKLFVTDLTALYDTSMDNYFPHADPGAIVKNFRKKNNWKDFPRLHYTDRGAEAFAKALAAKVDKHKIYTGEKITRIDVKKKVAYTDKRAFQFEHLVSSAPFNSLLEMCGVPFDKTLYTYSNILAFNLAFQSSTRFKNDWMYQYFPSQDLSFFRILYYNYFKKDLLNICVEIGLSQDDELSEQRRNELLAQTLSDLKRCGIIADEKLIVHHSVLLSPAYVHITKDGIADVKAKKELLGYCGVYSIGRYGSWQYYSMADSMGEARELADKFNMIDFF